MAAAACDRHLAEMDAARARGRTRAPLKGKPPQRPCPPDFDVIFVEIGRLECETWYRASRITINRWLKERGLKRLVKLRKAYVAHKRRQGEWITRSTRMVIERPRPPVERVPPRLSQRCKVKPALARHAAHFLRIRRNGGFIVSPTSSGDWWLGSRKVSAQALVEFAEAKGFNRIAANLQISAEEQVGN